MNRRQFLETAAAAAAVSPFIATSARAAANDRVRLGLIGCGGRMRQIAPMFLSHPNADVVAISDAIEPRADQMMQLLARQPRPQKPDRVPDYRKILDRSDIDAVVIATQQVWHGLPFIHACLARKHIYVEKPLSHTVVEGRAMVNAARKAGIIAMMGTQQRAGPHYQKAVEIVQSGRLGKIPLVECWNYHNTGRRLGRAPDSDPPPGTNWDLWLGPAPKVPYNPCRLSASWWFDYGGGMMTDWAVHHIDVIYWAMRPAGPTSVSCSGGKFVVDDLADAPDTIEATWEFPGWMLQYRYRGFNNFHSVQSRPNHHGICFHGNRATMVLDRFGYEIREDGKPGEISEKAQGIPYFDAKDPMKSEQDGPWQRAFVEAVKNGGKSPLDIERSHLATVCCLLGNIAYLSKRKFRFDPESESIPDDPQAAALLSRPRRKGYELPVP